ncbi:MAG: hypothetical protein KIT84_32970 [Labilithrix sp.]|nr:hypothetical protein [Labilithrix sp.]MCW5815888.1 hypothetical protein [Labilithrix sp.]
MATTRPIALRRARARRRAGGAALFIVAITLGLLAAMGAWSLAGTAQQVRAAGHGRQAAQGQHAAELAVTMTASMLTPRNARVVMNDMMADAAVRVSSRVDCTTSKPLTSGGSSIRDRVAEACLTLTPKSMKPYSEDPNNYPDPSTPPDGYNAPPYTIPFSNQSFGEVQSYANIRVELTNPIDWAAPAGYSVSSAAGPPPVFTVIRATVFAEMRPAAVGGVMQPAHSIVVGRGRLVVGPYMQ